jgi:hypothetical protein
MEEKGCLALITGLEVSDSKGLLFFVRFFTAGEQYSNYLVHIGAG